MSTSDDGRQTGVIIGTSIVTLITGYLLGLYTSQGYLISPSLVEERRRFRHDPIESDESDIDEEDLANMDHAPNWANGKDADRRQGLSAAAAAKKQEVVDTGEECKLILVVRTDLGMTKGKIAAQCSHATLACYKSLSRAASTSPQAANLLRRWESLGQAKIALQVKSQDEILQLQKQARAQGITAEVIQDAGRTQIEAGSMTVLGVGPAPRSAVDKITGHLKLL
ncbi:peptidyl-tRNA hydrolase PTH2 domain-containing protein [Sarocladium implicatum]|nr:peptidyl-tRNA hydrolase PTH2 domain-containing protein [Sarocladium implicatum]